MLDLVNILSTTVAWLKNNNSISTGISKSLNKQVQAFYQGIDGMHLEMPIPAERYPVIFVELESKSEDWQRIGTSSKRETEIKMNIVCVTHGFVGASNEGYSRQNADMECIKLTQNVEGFLRTNIPLSGTVDWNIIDNTEYNSTPGDSWYNCVGKIGCIAKLYTS